MTPEKPDTPPPSPLKGSIINHRKRRVISSSIQRNISHHDGDDLGNSKNTHNAEPRITQHDPRPVFVDDVKIAAAINSYNEQQSETDYFKLLVKELAKSSDIDIPPHILFEVTRGVEEKCSKQEHDHIRKEFLHHYMTSSSEREKRFRKCKAIMKRPPSLAPTNSPIYKARNNLRMRQLETKTIIDQKVNEVSEVERFALALWCLLIKLLRSPVPL